MDNYLEIAGTCVGLIYLWLEYKASIYLWIVGVVMPAIYIFVYYEAGLYADFAINIYYLLAAAYGWLSWNYGRGGKEDAASALSITHTPPRIYVPLCSVFVVTLVLIAWVLTEFTNSDVPWSDSFTTALSIVGIWMLARKYVEQWLVWIVVDVVCCGLYVYKELYFTAGLYGLYALIAIGGYKKWIQMMEEEK